MRKICSSIPLFILLMAPGRAPAQDTPGNKGLTVTAASANVSRGTWFEAPWVWVVGAGIFVLILFVIDRSRKKRAS